MSTPYLPGRTMAVWFRIWPAALLVASAVFAPWRNADPSSWLPGRVVAPLFSPPSAANYRLDVPVMAAEWVVIAGLWAVTRRTKPAPPSDL